jgi:hypothetical protein
MPGYRCYFLGLDGKIVEAEPVEADDELAALLLCRRLFAERPQHTSFELWRDDRKLRTESRAAAAHR